MISALFDFERDWRLDNGLDEALRLLQCFESDINFVTRRVVVLCCKQQAASCESTGASPVAKKEYQSPQ